MDKEFLTAEEALHRLKMRKEQLDALVNEGELRMYRHGGAAMFKTEDIESLRRRSETEATIVLPSKPPSAGDTDEESSEVEIESLDLDLDDSDQTSILPLDLPEVAVPKADAQREPTAVMPLEEPATGKTASEPMLKLDEDTAETVVSKPPKKGKTEIMEGLQAIDLDEVAEPPRLGKEPEAAAGRLKVMEAEEAKARLRRMMGAAEAESVTTAETSGLEPSAAEETVGLEPAEAVDVGTVPMDVVDASDSATVALEAVGEDIATAESAPTAGGMPSGFAGALPFEDVEAEDTLTLVGLVATGVVLLFGAVLWTGCWFMSSENPVITAFIGLFK